MFEIFSVKMENAFEEIARKRNSICIVKKSVEVLVELLEK